MSTFKSIEVVYHFIILIYSIGVVISCLEYLVIKNEFKPKGLYDWRIMQLSFFHYHKKSFWGILIEKLYGYVGTLLLLSLLILSSISLNLFAFSNIYFSIIALLHVLSSLLFSLRQSYGEDGSDQMNSIIALTIFICVGPHANNTVFEIGLFFIAGQACISYLSAGISKVVGKLWRSGYAVSAIVDTASYGSESVSKFLKGNPMLGRFITWGVIIFEVLFPLIIILPPFGVAIFLLLGFAFHLSCGIVMGLNSFIWSFVSTYPALIYVNVLFHNSIVPG